jgi:CHAD domain-containing protein
MAKKGKAPARVRAEQTAEEAFVTILSHHLQYLSEWELAARSWEDIEGVHQVRVTLRRMRSALTIFRPAIPKAATAGWAKEMRWAAGETGLARDLDVFITEALGAVSGKLELPGEQKLAEIAERHRHMAYERVRTMLDSERYGRLKQDFPIWLGQKGWREGGVSAKHLKRLEAPVVTFARKVLDKHERRVLAAGTNVDPLSAEQMHRLRIECKKLRYAAEFLTPLFLGMEGFIGHMKGLQDLLGVIHDVVVMRNLFERMLEGESDPEALQYAGGLVGWKACQNEHLKAGLDERWEDFHNAKHPWWKKSAVRR